MSPDSTDVPAASVNDLDKTELVPWPLPSELVLEGDPITKGAICWKSEDGRNASGFWSCSEGSFARTYTWTETACIIGGSAEVEVDGEVLKLSPGSLLLLTEGCTATWRVEKEITKAFHLLAADPLPF